MSENAQNLQNCVAKGEHTNPRRLQITTRYILYSKYDIRDIIYNVTLFVN